MTRLQCWSWTTDLKDWRWAGVDGNLMLWAPTATPRHFQMSSTLRTEGLPEVVSLLHLPLWQCRPGTSDSQPFGEGGKRRAKPPLWLPFLPGNHAIHLPKCSSTNSISTMNCNWRWHLDFLPVLSKYLRCLRGVRNSPNSFSNTRLFNFHAMVVRQVHF